MIHPSYKEMIEKINDTAEAGDMIITNRYSLVLAAAKRARQINAGSEPLVKTKSKEKNLSIAVDEFYAGRVHVLEDNSADEYDDYEYDYSEGSGYSSFGDDSTEYADEDAEETDEENDAEEQESEE